MTKKIRERIGVLAGGSSRERRISLKSGEAVFDALAQEGLDAIFVDIRDDSCECLKGLNIGVAFIALHGRYGEDGTIQNALENMGILYTGSGVTASQLAMDKIASRKIFQENGIGAPRYMAIDKSTAQKEILDRFDVPLVIKPKLEGSSIGLSIVRDRARLGHALSEMFRHGDEGIAEEYIDGRELTVGVLGGAALPVIEIVPRKKVYDYAAKYEDVQTEYLVPAPLDKKVSDEIRSIALRAHNLLGCRDFSRVDIRMDGKGKSYVLEVNSIPGLTERSLLPKAAKAAGIGFNELCVKLIRLALNRKSIKGKDHGKR